jgi:hypothetical protein
LVRRAARTARPARVRIRSRKPWVLARRRLFGWYVRLLTVKAFRVCPRGTPRQPPVRGGRRGSQAYPLRLARPKRPRGTGRPIGHTVGRCSQCRNARTPAVMPRHHGPQPADRTAVEGMWTTLLACAVADSERRAAFTTSRAKPTSCSFVRHVGDRHKHRPDLSALFDTQAVDNLWTVGGYGGHDPGRLGGRAGRGGEVTGVGRNGDRDGGLRRGVERRDRTP